MDRHLPKPRLYRVTTRKLNDAGEKTLPPHQDSNEDRSNESRGFRYLSVCLKLEAANVSTHQTLTNHTREAALAGCRLSRNSRPPYGRYNATRPLVFASIFNPVNIFYPPKHYPRDSEIIETKSTRIG